MGNTPCWFLALVSGRFRLDPRAPEPDRYVPPPPTPLQARAAVAPPPAAPAPPPPPAPVAAAATTSPTRRRVLVVGAIVVAILLVGGAVAVFVATALGYPDKYVLEGNERPSGMTDARLSQDEMDDLGITSNPGEIDKARLQDEFETNDGRSPDQGNAQVLQAGSGRVVILALKYQDEEQARDATSQLRALCSFANGAVLRDADVRVAIVPDEGASRSDVRAVAAALLEKTSALEAVCGAG